MLHKHLHQHRNIFTSTERTSPAHKHLHQHTNIFTSTETSSPAQKELHQHTNIFTSTQTSLPAHNFNFHVFSVATGCCCMFNQVDYHFMPCFVFLTMTIDSSIIPSTGFTVIELQHYHLCEEAFYVSAFWSGVHVLCMKAAFMLKHLTAFMLKHLTVFMLKHLTVFMLKHLPPQH
ncbi:hypothetical protein BsWGS_27416 [Bradybaena similaris]